MAHEPQIRINKDSDTAVLLVHGILGTPHQFDPLLDAVPKSFSFVNLLLDGHGGSVKNFGRSSMAKWKKQVADCVKNLCAAHENVVIIAHSMGTLFAIDAAVKHPDRVKGLFLLSPPLCVGVKARLFRNAFIVGFDLPHREDAQIAATRHAYSLEPDRNVFHYARWIPRYLELFRKIRATREMLTRLNTPTKAYLCLDDEMVSVRSEKFLRPVAAVQLAYLPHSTHFVYGEADAKRLRRDLTAFFTELSLL